MRVTVTLFFIIAMLTACSKTSNAIQGNECWLHVLDMPGKSKNELTICRTNARADIHIYYPNNIFLLNPPTTCQASGTARESKGGMLNFDFAEGVCKNGRSLNATSVTCSLGKSRMLCKYSGTNLTFTQIKKNL